MGMQAGRQWGCLAGVGQRGVGAAGPCTLHYGGALASSDMALGPLEAFSPAPRLPPLILALAGPPAPLGLCWHYLGWRDGEAGGKLKLSWKQMTCVRLVVGMGVAMETASPNSILHPTPDAQLP